MYIDKGFNSTDFPFANKKYELDTKLAVLLSILYGHVGPLSIGRGLWQRVSQLTGDDFQQMAQFSKISPAIETVDQLWYKYYATYH